MEYAIGTKYLTRGKFPRLCTVIEILKTYNSKSELVKVRYISEHEFMGQSVLNHDVVPASIAMGIFELENKKK